MAYAKIRAQYGIEQDLYVKTGKKPIDDTRTMGSKTAEFFENGSSKQFEFVLTQYPEALQSMADSKKSKSETLIKLDKWFQNDLPKKIKSRGKEAHITHEEIVQTIKWKLARGKFRPRLKDLITMNTPRMVVQESKKSFRNLFKRNDLEAAIQSLSSLKGVGPAMASAIITAAAPEIAPFMADECLLSMPDIEGIDYTMKEYMKYVEKTRECVERLNSQSQGSPQWTPHTVELAIWTHYVAWDMKPELLSDMPLRHPGINGDTNGATTNGSNGTDTPISEVSSPAETMSEDSNSCPASESLSARDTPEIEEAAPEEDKVEEVAVPEPRGFEEPVGFEEPREPTPEEPIGFQEPEPQGFGEEPEVYAQEEPRGFEEQPLGLAGLEEEEQQQQGAFGGLEEEEQHQQQQAAEEYPIELQPAVPQLNGHSSGEKEANEEPKEVAAETTKSIPAAPATNGTNGEITKEMDSESSETNGSVALVPEYTKPFADDAEYQAPVQEYTPQQTLSACSPVEKAVAAPEPSMTVSKRPAPAEDDEEENHEAKRLKEDTLVSLQVPIIQAGGD